MPPNDSAFEETLANARQALLRARNAAGHWEGELSSSALSTVTALFALSLNRAGRGDPAEDLLIERGLGWLAQHQNPDGGWGDTVKSFSNISTTALCWAAMSGVAASQHAGAIARAQEWLTKQAGGIEPARLAPAIIARYGKDRTFSVPILTMCALAGRLGEGREAWRWIPQLPFELAAFPQRGFKWLRLPVVSYALPALIAMGIVRHTRRPTRNPIRWAARRLARNRTLHLLERIQPPSGGYLEATPLTSFVVMSLIGASLAEHPVVQRGIAFLVRSARPDGSWAIDTNLATWVTTLSVNALAGDLEFERLLPAPERERICRWLLDQQYRVEHPYTLADPGCWAWTDQSGGVPDADDTPGALLALKHLGPADRRAHEAAEMGVKWLMNLQNSDGGIPTFCKGWGKLPFDRSSADLSAHALRAWAAWLSGLPDHSPDDLQRQVRSRISAALNYLVRAQRADGAWAPLWFGNQHAPEEENLTYGTARVLCMGPGFGEKHSAWQAATERGLQWLLSVQNPDGGWGGARSTPSTIEETSQAIEALAMHGAADEAVARGVDWLIARTDRGRLFEPSPIGFYFAKLWYFEKLYPVIFTVAALNAVKVAKQAPHASNSGNQ